MNSALNITAAKQGVIIGIIAMFIGFIYYAMGNEAFIGFANISAGIVIFSLTIYLGRKERSNEMEGYMTYVEALFYTTIIFFIAGYFYEITFILIINFLDPSIKDFILEEGLKGTEQTLRMVKMDEAKIDEMMENMERELKNSFNPYSLLYNSWTYLLRAVIFGSIGALFLRKTKPDFVEE